MAEKFLPLNVRILVLKPGDVTGQIALMCAIPVPGKPAGTMTTTPCRLQISLIDDDGKEKWFDVPFEVPEKSVIELDTPVKGSRN